MKPTETMIEAGIRRAYPTFDVMSDPSKKWAREKVTLVAQAVLEAAEPEGLLSGASAGEIHQMQLRIAELEQALGRADAKIERYQRALAVREEELSSSDTRTVDMERQLADALAQAKHAEALLAVYDHSDLEKAMACLESLASYVGANGQTVPHTVEQLDERIRWGIDHNVDVWKKRAEAAQRRVDEVHEMLGERENAVAELADEQALAPVTTSAPQQLPAPTVAPGPYTELTARLGKLEPAVRYLIAALHHPDNHAFIRDMAGRASAALPVDEPPSLTESES